MCLAIPGQIKQIKGDDPLLRVGHVLFGTILKEINLACVPEAKIGDYVLVHAGLAISLIDEIEAIKVFEALQESGEFELSS